MISSNYKQSPWLASHTISPESQVFKSVSSQVRSGEGGLHGWRGEKVTEGNDWAGSCCGMGIVWAPLGSLGNISPGV